MTFHVNEYAHTEGKGNIMKRAFTLIELLIVIAIIAILALIAVPNFLEAQIRAKVSRATADMRSLATAMEAYAVDWGRPLISGTEYRRDDNGENCIPGAPNIGGDQAMNSLTTPVSYIGTHPRDPFIDNTGVKNYSTGNLSASRRTYIYLSDYNCSVARENNANYRDAYSMGYLWSIHSFGPMKNSAGNVFVPGILSGKSHSNPMITQSAYDSSNGTMSMGFIIRTNKGGFTGQPGR